MNTEQTAHRFPRRNYMSIPEVAEAKGVTRVAVLYAIRTKRIKAWRPEGRREWLIPIDEAEKYIDSPIKGRRPKEATASCGSS